jgi:uncharacterized protein
LACRFADVDCDSYDFFYTIKSPAGIVGGPSAGGAVTALTVAMLKDLAVDQDAAMTGSINSGNLIGPVGSLKAKIDGAKSAGIHKVLIPAVQSTKTEDDITDIVGYGKSIGVEVVPVATLQDALKEFTGKDFAEEEKDVEVPLEYQQIMREVSEALCDRTKGLMGQVNVLDLSENNEIRLDRVQLLREAQNLTQKGNAAFDEENYYSAASYCFGAGIKANTLLYTLKKMTKEESDVEALRLRHEIDEFDKVTEAIEKETITDLQTYMIVKERILEARQHLHTGNNDSSSFGYVDERLNSAITWSAFFGEDGEKYDIDEESLKESCTQMLGETDERFQYLNMFFPGLLEDLKNNLLTAHKHYGAGEYALCIYLAGRTKAEANVIVTMLGVKEDYVEDLLEQKIDAARQAVVKQIDKGTFPIIAYSYFEYANSLRSENKYSALLYSEYALELSDIDIYFKKKKSTDSARIMEGLRKYLPTAIFVWGLVLGVLVGWLIMRGRAGKAEPARGEKKVKKKVVRRVVKKKGRTNIRLS